MNTSFDSRRRKLALRFWLVLALCLLRASSAFAQHQHQQQVLHQPATLIPNLGAHNHPVTTTNAEAQKFFNQGLLLIYGFNHEEARRSFEQAARLDPKLAMAHWGMALAVGPNYNESQIDPDRLLAADRALEKAQELAANASAQERAYINALAKRFQLKTDLKRCNVDYKDAMAALVKSYPDDLDAATLYADALMNLIPWQLWSKDGKPATETVEVVAVLESVLKRDPNHIGANHLYIHAVEASREPGRGLASADRLAKLAPAAGHLVHMPSHIYIRTGNYEAAAKANEDAAVVDRDYIKHTGVTGIYPAMYYSHNLHFALEAYNRMGNYASAVRQARLLEENVRGHLQEMAMLESFLPSSLIFVHLRFNRWDEVLKLPAPTAETPITQTMWHYGRGVALAGQGKLAEAKRERQQFLTAARATPGETPFGLNTAPAIFKIAEHALDARIAAAEGNKGAAVAHWRKAVAAEDALNYDEPPGWYYSTRESLGAALLKAGNAAEAEAVFRQDLTKNPNSGRALFGLVESLRAQGKMQAARTTQSEFERAWKNADVKLRLADL